MINFAVLPNPRIARQRQYPLLEILFLCVSASLSGHEEWDEVGDFGQAQLAWVRRYLPFESGIPAPDTLNRVRGRLDPRAFEKRLLNWVQPRTVLPSGAQICADSKRRRRSAALQHGARAGRGVGRAVASRLVRRSEAVPGAAPDPGQGQ